MSTITGFDFFLQQVRPELRSIADYSFTTIFNSYQDIIRQLQPYLVQAARQYQDEKEKALYITALEQIQRFQPQMTNAFAFHLLEAMQILTGETTGQMNSAQVMNAFNSLSQHGREDDLYLKHITEQCLTRNSARLGDLRQCLQTALGISIDVNSNPFSPVFICNALTSSLRIQQVHSRIRREILTLFNDALFTRLDDIYQALLQQLEKAGFIPKNTNSTHSSNTDILDIIDTAFNDLLTQHIIPAEFGKPYQTLHRPYSHAMSLKAVDQLLESLQKGYDPQTDGTLSALISSRLTLDDKGNKDSTTLTRHDENIINLTGLLFRQIADSVEGRSGDLFLRLSIPYARLILQDELFFHDKNHPARLMLNKLTQLVHSNPDDGLAFKQAQFYTTKILMRFNGELSLFTELAGDIDERLTQYQQLPEQDLAKINQRMRKEEQQQLIQKAITALVSKHTHSLSRKLRFHVLLDIFLQQILLNVYQQHGKDSIEWKNVLHFISTLIPALDNRNRETFIAAGKHLAQTVKTLNRYLIDCHISNEWRRSFFDQMQEIHILLSKGNTLKNLDDDTLKHTPAIDIIIDHYESERTASIIETAIIGHEHKHRRPPIAVAISDPDKAMKKVSHLNIGQWINTIIDDRRIPCFLSHKSSQRKVLVFCNRQQQKLFERSENDLQQDFLTGYAGTLEKTDSFDEALRLVVKQLKQSE